MTHKPIYIIRNLIFDKKLSFDMKSFSQSTKAKQLTNTHAQLPLESSVIKSYVQYYVNDPQT